MNESKSVHASGARACAVLLLAGAALALDRVTCTFAGRGGRYTAVRETSLGVAPGDCAAIEDSSNGLRAAAAAGCAVIAVPHGVYPPAEDALAASSLVVHDLDELTVEAVRKLGQT